MKINDYFVRFQRYLGTTGQLDLLDRLAMSNSTSGLTKPANFHFKVSTFYTSQVDNLMPAATETRSPWSCTRPLGRYGEETRQKQH